MGLICWRGLDKTSGKVDGEAWREPKRHWLAGGFICGVYGMQGVQMALFCQGNIHII